MIDVTTAAALISRRELSVVDLIRQSLARIEAVQPRINAFVEVYAEEALTAAHAAQQEIDAGRSRGPLHGMPVALKDLFDVAGKPTSASSRVRRDHRAAADAQCVTRLRQAGAIIIGKTHTHEFAFGTLTPQTRNPWNPDHVPGGSSGGSAAAVAAGCCALTLGSDTGGSIRIPAAACGVVGLKPSYGRVGGSGVTPLAWSLDHAGPITRTVRDAALLLGAIAGYDSHDPASVKLAVPDYSAGLEEGVRGLRLGIPVNYYFDHVDGEVERCVRAAISRLVDLGGIPVEVELPHAELYLSTTNAIIMAEAAEYHHQTLCERAADYGDEVRALLEAGSLAPAIGYIRALRLRERIRRAWAETLTDVDVLLAPAIPGPAARRDQILFGWPDGRQEPVEHAYVRLSCPANLTGLPALSLPCGFTDAGLPVGLQIIGGGFDEATVLRVGAAYEAATSWHEQTPVL